MVLRLSDWNEHKIEVCREIRKQDGSKTVEKIEPFDASREEQVVLDLHVGYDIRQPDNDDPVAIGSDLEISPHECLRIDTEEVIALPSNVFGVLSCRYSISARGLWIANAKIDPNFRGALRVTVMNSTNRRITLKAREAFCSIYLHLLPGP